MDKLKIMEYVFDDLDLDVDFIVAKKLGEHALDVCISPDIQNSSLKLEWALTKLWRTVNEDYPGLKVDRLSQFRFVIKLK